MGVNVIGCLLLEIPNAESGLERPKGTTGELFDFHDPGGGNNLNTLRQLELGNQGPDSSLLKCIDLFGHGLLEFCGVVT